MKGEPVSLGEIALAQMEKATDAQKIALAIQLALSVESPREAASMIRLANVARDRGEDLLQRQFTEENEG